MKIIKDIRLYKDALGSMGNKHLKLSAHRVAMKLREQAFSLGDYDHLYLCFSTDEPAGSIILDEKVDRYFPWFRKVHIGVTPDEMLVLETAEEPSYLFELMKNVLLTLFGSDPSVEEVIRYAIEEAQKGSDMLMQFKEKKSPKGTATIYLRLLDNTHYLPVLVVTKSDGTEALRKDLPETADLGNMGKIQLSSKKVTVKPRKNAFTKNLSPVFFEISL